jgi:hypothetical protein
MPQICFKIRKVNQEWLRPQTNICKYEIRDSYKAQMRTGNCYSSLFPCLWILREGRIKLYANYFKTMTKWNISVKVKVKSLCFKHNAMKTNWGSGDLAPRILDLGTRWRWVVSFTPRPLYPQGNSPCYLLDRRLSGPQNRSGRGEEKNSQPPPGIEPLEPWSSSP